MERGKGYVKISSIETFFAVKTRYKYGFYIKRINSFIESMPFHVNFLCNLYYNVLETLFLAA